MIAINNDIMSITVHKNRYAHYPQVYSTNFIVVGQGKIISLKHLVDNVYIGNDKIIYRITLDKKEEISGEEYASYIKYLLGD